MKRLPLTLVLIAAAGLAAAQDVRISLTRPEVTLSTHVTKVFIADPKDKLFVPPRVSEIPNNAYGDLVRLGRNIFVDTQHYARRYVGNGLNCSNCHIGEGRTPGAMPLWAAYNIYPLYRGKNLRANSFPERIGECFRYSLNGLVPTRDSIEMKALIAYAQWLSATVPMRQVMTGRGVPGAPTVREPSPDRGEIIYRYQCAICHGHNGAGVKRADGAGYQFPPLWGSDSYDKGAGLNKLRTGAGFIRANMPPGKGFSLSGQDAMDVSLYLHLQDRPWDPRIGWFSVFMSELADG